MSTKHPLTRGKKQKAHALLAQQRLSEARTLLEQACRLDRRDAEAWYLLGAIDQQLERFDEAMTCYRQAVALRPDNADAHYHLANVLSRLGQRTEAAEHYRRAIALNPGHVEAHCNLGGLHELEGRPAEALACHQQALRLAPERAELHYNAACALRRLGQSAAAEQHYRDAIRLQPGFAEAYNNLANLLQQRGATAEAVACYRRATGCQPAYVEAHYNLGMALRELGHVNEAIASYRRAIRLDPNHADAHFGLSVLLLLTGNYQAGWSEYEWHWRRSGSPSRPLPASSWNGTDLEGREVFLHAEQGLGDEIFFLRFLPRLKARGAGAITYRPSPKIAPLLARARDIDRLAEPQEQARAGQLVFAVGDLPRLLGMERPDQIPEALRLSPLPARVEAMRRQLAELGPPPYVGVTWRAGTRDNLNRLYKESPLAGMARALKDVPATALVLQRHPAAGEVEAFQQALGRPVHDFSALNEDLESMLALLSLLDDYVGVSNTNMHLRAAVGKTARVLVPAPPEWRWMAEGRESPWFPGFGVYRQGYDGDWQPAMRELAHDLRRAGGG